MTSEARLRSITEGLVADRQDTYLNHAAFRYAIDTLARSIGAFVDALADIAHGDQELQEERYKKLLTRTPKFTMPVAVGTTNYPLCQGCNGEIVEVDNPMRRELRLRRGTEDQCVGGTLCAVGADPK